MAAPVVSPTRTGPFSSHPQQFPRTQNKAAQLVAQMHRLIQKGPRTLVATVIDTSFQASMGYVLATTQLGVVQVYAVPYGTVVPQMRLFVRQVGPAATNRHFVFDGFAPALSARSLSSGSLLYTTTTGDSTTVPAQTSVGGIPSATGLSTAVGYYWHCFFYLPGLPQAARVTLFSMANAGATNTITLEYLSTGQLVLRSVENNHGYITSGPVSPHSIHWLVCQPGLGASEFLIDGQAAYGGIQGPGDAPYFWGNGATYTGSFLSTPAGTQTPPLGTWLSKFGYGYSYASGSLVALAAGLVPPTSDSGVPNLNIATTQKTQNLYLCLDTPGSGSLANMATAGTGSAVTLATAYASLVAPGPY
jgi:hypothetical protein